MNYINELKRLSIIKSFELTGLYGRKTLSISFNGSAKILVADNGAGKTTILNALYALLSGNIAKLVSIPFNTVAITFEHSERIEIKYSDLPNPYGWLEGPHAYLAELKTFLSDEDLREFAAAIDAAPEESFWEYLPPQLRDKISVPPIGLYRAYSMLQELRKAYKPEPLSKSLIAKLAAIKRNFPLKFIYLPTYRRVEEDLRNLGLPNGENTSRSRRTRVDAERHIFFGMNDVRQRFDSVTSKIKLETAETFRAMAFRMIDELLEGRGIENSISTSNDFFRAGHFDLILKRLKKELSSHRKTQIKKIISEGASASEENKVLLYLLSNLSEISEQQAEKDKQIQKFCEIAKNYLVGKKITYNEVDLTLDIFRDGEDKPLSLDRLSSGEKQLVSILSRLYLADGSDYALFIDEPELSLSIDWQKTFLPDLINSGSCKFLLAATHSPFIFANALDKLAAPIVVKKWSSA
ncbi:AAA family ATPase [Burkholderia ambifaria]|jgi:predicted ATPase|uniref:AAA family ATPase n=1 Tax=Burkholderia ambifaria TaxID=152480 RepID=UPI000CFF5BE1|nr:AAA family ATPase [Burkholderia ambifaria]PRG10707.1 hypothetical protein C6Q14_04075 [Burkholderia ambifaria]